MDVTHSIFRRRVSLNSPGLLTHSWSAFCRRRTWSGLDAMPTSAMISRNSSSPASHSCWTSSPPATDGHGSLRRASHLGTIAFARNRFVFGRCCVQIPTGGPAIVTKVSGSPTQSLQANHGTVLGKEQHLFLQDAS